MKPVQTFKIAIFLAGVLVIAGCAEQTQYPVNFNPDSLPNPPELPSSGGATKLCGDWPDMPGILTEQTSVMPSDFPSAFAYPESTLLGKSYNSQVNSGTRNAKGEITEGILYKSNLYFCTDDSVGSVIDYYKGLKVDGYTNFYIEPLPDFFRTSVNEKSIKTADDYTWYNSVLVEGTSTGGKTLVHIIFSEVRDAL